MLTFTKCIPNSIALKALYVVTYLIQHYEETVAQRHELSPSHIASKWQSWASNLGLVLGSILLSTTLY